MFCICVELTFAAQMQVPAHNAKTLKNYACE